ncbi:segregation and condensation protein A [Acidisoma cladoniae]|uniref:segregation and condensation protein A n=1 Tax=Acidisoma cladoniae TaxID=3040935 RepID=UPI00254AFABF|nr:segregation/condensation protein A [Acidisoma sp. PAMC 29798]
MSDGPTVGEEREEDAAEGSGDPIWDDWSTPPRVAEMPMLHLDGFDGPMDLLLDLAERQRIDFGRMSIRDLAEQFVASMERLVGRVSLEHRADWLVLATRLVLLRSRLLFPASPEAAIAAEQDAAAEVRRLEEMVFVRAAAAWLTARPQLGTDVFARPAATAPSREGGYVALMEACLVVLRGRGGRPDEAPPYQPVIPDLWRVTDALARIRLTLAEHPEGGELSAFLPAISADVANRDLRARAAVASTLLAGLELAREGVLAIEQEEDYGPMSFAHRATEDAVIGGVAPQ